MNRLTGSILLFLLVLVELLSASYWTQYIHLDICRYVHLAAGLFIPALLFVKPNDHSIQLSIIPRWIVLGILVWFIIWSAKKLQLIYCNHPLDYTQADMLPVLKVMCERWLSFKSVYEIIPEIWGGILPVYLPAMYLPFIPSVLFHFDMRWITYAFALFPLLYSMLKNRTNTLSIFVIVPVGLFFDYTLHQKHEVFALSEEGIVYGYYMALCYALYRKKVWWVAVFSVCCVLSRYSALFFFLALVITYFVHKEYDPLKKYITISLILGVLFITIGGAWTYLPGLFTLSSSYLENIQSNIPKYQQVLNEAIGMMPLIGIHHAGLVYKLQIGLLILCAFCMVLCYKKSKSVFYLLSFLKLQVVLFYNFLILPYPYLMYTSVLVSILIFYLYATNQSAKDYLPIE